jgi:hypothetical protein
MISVITGSILRARRDCDDLALRAEALLLARFVAVARASMNSTSRSAGNAQIMV